MAVLLLSLLPIVASQGLSFQSYLRAMDEGTTLSATNHPVCPSEFHSCMRSNQCSSGTVCSSGNNNKPCCTDASNNCPSPLAMGVSCNKQRSTNWCSSNSDCGSSTGALCCATGCGYNICVPTKEEAPRPRFHSFVAARFADDASIAHGSDSECPSPDQVPVQCSNTRPMDWCLRHDECPSTPTNKRLCCLTSCGHHVCMRRAAGRWIIA